MRNNIGVIVNICTLNNFLLQRNILWGVAFVCVSPYLSSVRCARHGKNREK